MQLVRWLDEITMADLPSVGGKNASLGEMISNLSAAGINVPGGFATTAEAFRLHLEETGLATKISSSLRSLDIDDVVALASAGREIRGWIEATPLPGELDRAIREGYAALAAEGDANPAVAVRSSATAEDLPDASFAGQQETYLNVVGADAVVDATRRVFASLYNDRAIAYRVHKGFSHYDVALSAGIQRMARSDVGTAGVAFSIDTESGFDDVVFITASYGLGELLVQGAINPDEFYVSKSRLRRGKDPILQRRIGSKHQRMVYGDGSTPVRVEDVPAGMRRTFSLDDPAVVDLARMVLTIEEHYGRPMDVEWALDGVTGKLMILQARPETVQSQTAARVIERFELQQTGDVLIEGRSVGQRIGAGTVRIVRDSEEMDRVQPGDVLVTDMTDPDWEPVMKRASAIVTNRGGRTCHAAIIARELEIPAVVGSGDATAVLDDGATVTVSCAEGDTGYVYAGALPFDVRRIELDAMPDLPVKIMMNVANPERAFSFAQMPNHGVGLARVEFVINNVVGVHPRALLDYAELPTELQEAIDLRTAGYADPASFFTQKLAEGIATIAAAFDPEPVIVRLSDFKSNEYAHLLGGDRYEPHEENPMIGFRGASRYRDPAFRNAFDLECQALRYVREDMGFDNVEIMIPFVRTLDEAEQVLGILAENGIERGRNGLRLIMMCEVPSNAILAEQFLVHFDGFSIGSNDLTQFTLALDRDSGLVADLFNERDPAVKALITRAIEACRRAGKYIGICGQGPSDHPDFAAWLRDEGIASISLNPDTVLETWLMLAGVSADEHAG
ncbi:MAG TPA: phosphoenolpyruvate synthase [Acidimicrobiia bacterium]|jgi:pyruvate,water dikinase|nr:phosphoenolpyruvate synthase [Acidimicrobiia bacterium]